MRIRVGIGVGACAVRAVGVRRGRVLWAVEAALEPGEPLEPAIVELLGRVQLPRWPRASVVAAVGPSRAQTKRLHGLPPISDARLLAKLVAEGAGRFFLKNGVPLATGGVCTSAVGETWGAAYDESVVSAIEAAARTLRLDLRAIVPTVAVLGQAIEGGRITWADGERTVEVTTERGALRAVCRVPIGENGASSIVGKSRASLAALGEDACRFADAYGAALLERGEPLAARRKRRSFAHEDVPRWRSVALVLALALSAAAALVAPALAAMRASRIAEAHLARLAPRRAAAIAMEAEVARVTAALTEISGFEAKLKSHIGLLAGLADALGEESAIIALRADSVGGSVILVAPRALLALTRLEHVSGTRGVEVVGPVTKEVVADRDLERVAIRYRDAR